MGPVMSEITRILSQIEGCDPSTAQQLLPLVYDELRKLAAAKLSRELPGQTLQPTALVHEAYMRLVGSEGQGPAWENRGHFFAAAAEAMRRILVDMARRKRAEVHGGGKFHVSLSEVSLMSLASPDRIVAIDDALTRLAKQDHEAAELIKMRVFAGCSLEDAASVLGLSRATAYRHWMYARAWLRAELADD
jgi:RNA polymerase sigma factor (TIGR02999 family)